MIYKLKDNRVLRAYYGGKRIDKFLGKTECKDSRYPEEWVASVTRAKNNGVFNGNEGMSYCEDGRYSIPRDCRTGRRSRPSRSRDGQEALSRRQCRCSNPARAQW